MDTIKILWYQWRIFRLGCDYDDVLAITNSVEDATNSGLGEVLTGIMTKIQKYERKIEAIEW